MVVRLKDFEFGKQNVNSNGEVIRLEDFSFQPQTTSPKVTQPPPTLPKNVQATVAKDQPGYLDALRQQIPTMQDVKGLFGNVADVFRLSPQEKQQRIQQNPVFQQIARDPLNLNKNFQPFNNFMDAATFGMTSKGNELVYNVTGLPTAAPKEKYRADDPKTVAFTEKDPKNKVLKGAKDLIVDPLALTLTNPDRLGELAGYFVPGAAIESGIMKAAKPVIESLPKFAQRGITGGAAGFTDATLQEVADVTLRNQTYDPINPYLGLGLGAGANIGLGALGDAISPALNKLSPLPQNRPQPTAQAQARPQPIVQTQAQARPQPSAQVQAPTQPIGQPRTFTEEVFQTQDTIQQPNTIQSPEAVQPPTTARTQKPITNVGVNQNRKNIQTSSGQRIDIEYELIEADDLIASNDPITLKQNPNYDQTLQPRDRDKTTYEFQIQDILNENKFNPDRLVDSSTTDTGAPIVFGSMVESGNGRTMALQRGYLTNHPSAQVYRDYLNNNAGQFGFTPEQVASMKNPILVRVRKTNLSQKQKDLYLKESNESTSASLGATEQAKLDSRIIDDRISSLIDDEGNIDLTSTSNKNFVISFLQNVVAKNELNRYIDSNNMINQEGITRIRNAIYAKAYENEQAIARMVESTDDNVKNVSQALLNFAPRLIKLKAAIKNGELYDADVSKDLVNALIRFSDIKRQKQTVDGFLKQVSVFDEITDVEKSFLVLFDQMNRKRQKLTNLFNSYADVLETFGSPNQATLFGDIEAPTKLEILSAATKLENDKGEMLDADLFTFRDGEGGSSQQTVRDDTPAQTTGTLESQNQTTVEQPKPAAKEESVKRPVVKVEETPRQAPEITSTKEQLPKKQEQKEQETKKSKSLAEYELKDDGMKERKFVTSLKESDKPPEAFKEKLKAAYRPISNQETLDKANARIEDSTEESFAYVMSDERYNADKATVAQRLIDIYNQNGDFERAVTVAEKIAKESTTAGQGIQALSMLDRLTPEGILIYATRLANKANKEMPVGVEEVKVTKEMAEEIVGLAQVTQKMTGVKELSNNVVNILEDAKAGKVLTDEQKSILQSFVDDARQFVKEVSKTTKVKEAKEIKDKRIRDQVRTFLDAQEKAALERIRSRKNTLNSFPIDVWRDYIIVGAAKMGKGTINFVEWSEQITKDLGDDIQPYLENLYERSKEMFELSAKKVSSTDYRRMEKITSKVVKDMKLDAKEADTLIEYAKRIDALSGEEKRFAQQDLQFVLQQLDRPTTLRKISSAQTMAMLVNPKTFIRNALGNELFYRVERLNKLFATPIDITRSNLTGGQRTVTFRTNKQGEFWRNFMIGARAGWKGINPEGLQTQYDLGSSPAFRGRKNPLTYFEKLLGASLKGFDYAGYKRSYNETIGELATLRAINEGQGNNKRLIESYIRNMDDNLDAIAQEYGRYVTFQDDNWLSKGAVGLKRAMNFKKDFGLGDIILKFPRTPAALLMRALEYSPAGFVRSAAELIRPWYRKEPPDVREIMLSLSRAIVGTLGFSGLGYYMFDKGIITGTSSKDRDIRELNKMAGAGQYQVNLSALSRFIQSGFNEQTEIKEGDLLYSYDWAQPVAISYSMGANMKNNIEQKKDLVGSLTKGTLSTVYDSFEGGLESIFEQSFLQGIRRAIEGYPGQTITDKIEDIVADIPATFIPTAFNQIRQLKDPFSREFYDPNKAKESLNKTINRIPGLSEKLPQQYDTLGGEKKPYQDNSLFNVMLNPGFQTRYTLTPEAKYIVDLIRESQDIQVAPRKPFKTIEIDGQSVKLTNEEYAKLQKYQGEATRRLIERNMNKDSNKRLERRVDNVKKSLTEAGKDARKELMRER